jgi:hypothetical protein
MPCFERRPLAAAIAVLFAAPQAAAAQSTGATQSAPTESALPVLLLNCRLAGYREGGWLNRRTAAS